MDFFGRNTRVSALSGAAESYYLLGYSVIPVYGDSDPARAKVAAVNWQPFQQRRATPRQFKTWFQEQQFGGLAIVTGRISGLVVLDFDDPELADDFACRYPHLTKTRTVLSANRNLPHYYYELPSSISLASSSGSGVDLQANGRYVVAPPTHLGNLTYTVKRGGQPLQLTAAQTRLIQNFVSEQRVSLKSPVESERSDSVEPATGESAARRESVTVTSSKERPVQAASERPSDATVPLSPEDARSLYRHYAPRTGRNNALFQTSLRLRDTGWLLADTLACLRELHAQQSTTNTHPPETLKQRRREAERTIRSAYSRPPGRPQTASEDADTLQTAGLPNSVREAFLQRKQGFLVRVLDALLQAGAEPGQLVTEKILVNALDGIVGRYSILKALKATYHDKSPVFCEYEGDIQNVCSNKTPSPGTPTPATAASAIAEDTNNKCLLFRVTEPDKNKSGDGRGRPPTYYVIPRIEAICARLDVKYTHSDPLQADDLQSMKKYRQGLEREFIKRAPGLYPRRWLAARLGISVRTMQRYRHEMPLKQRNMFFRRLITWENLDSIPQTEGAEGIFLQDETGKRYPPVGQLAARLLAERKTVFLMHQDVNYYWHPATPPSPLAMMGIHPKQHDTLQRQSASSGYSTEPPQRTFAPLSVHLNPSEQTKQANHAPQSASESQKTRFTEPVAGNQAESVTKSPETPQSVTQSPEPTAPPPFKPKSDRYYRRELPGSNAEYYAMKLYQKTHTLCQAKKQDNHPGYLSKVSARRLTDQYGYHLVKKLVQVLSWRTGIENPAGFAVVWLRSTSKSLDYQSQR